MENTEKFLLWKQYSSYDDDKYTVVDIYDIEAVVDLKDQSVVQTDIPVLEMNKLQTLLDAAFDDEDFSILNEDDLKDFLTANGYDDADVSYMDDYPEPDEILCYDFSNKIWFNLNDCDVLDSYEWWDGHNWKREFCEESVTFTVGNSISLDEWDGHNFVTDYTGKHQEVYKVLEEDGRAINNSYLVVYSSQWEGSQTTAAIMDEVELREHLADIERNVDEYMEKVLAL